jgi:hypothetical protein
MTEIKIDNIVVDTSTHPPITIHTHMYVRMCVYVRMYIYIYIYIYKLTFLFKNLQPNPFKLVRSKISEPIVISSIARSVHSLHNS